VAGAPNLQAYADKLGVPLDQFKKILMAWGPGKYDAELNQDGKGFRPDGKSGATLLPAAFGLAGVNNHTYTGAWGNVTYWNAYVANTQMRGQGTFIDPRLQGEQYPMAAKLGNAEIRHTPDLVTGKLAALHFYQLALPAPRPPKGSFNESAAKNGETVFNNPSEVRDVPRATAIYRAWLQPPRPERHRHRRLPGEPIAGRQIPDDPIARPIRADEGWLLPRRPLR
jgi:hypothetical protein